MTQQKSRSNDNIIRRVSVSLKVAAMLLLLDSLVNSLPSAYAIALPRTYLQEKDFFYFLRFFQQLGFGMLIYITHVFGIYVVLPTVFVFTSYFIKENKVYSTGLGTIIAFSFYLIYALNFSVDIFLGYFGYRIVWYALLGGIFGWIYFKKCFAITQLQ